jgi:hypothetical protein
VVSRTGTNVVRFAVAALLGLAACLVAWWPQSAAGSGDAVVVSSPAAALPTQKTPTPTQAPTATVAPTTAAPPPAPPPAQPTKKPTKKPTRKPPTLHNSGGNNNGGSNNNGSGSSSHNNPPATHSGTVSTSAPYVPPAAPTAPAAPTTKHTPTKTPTAAPTTEVPTPEAQPVTDDTSTVDTGVDDAETYDTYLTSSEPVQTKTAPVWVVPGILLVLTSMLALLGGVLGRGSRPALARVKASNESDEPTES